MNKNQPVTFRELIDAIAVLHVIDDSPKSSASGSELSFSTILNKPGRSRGKRRTNLGQSPYSLKVRGRSIGLDEITKTSNTKGE